MKKFLLGIQGLVFCSFIASLSYEQQVVTDLVRYGKLSDQEKQALLACAALESHKVKKSDVDIPLFKAYPILREHVSYINLGSLPTPIYHCKKLGESFERSHVYVKCDNKTGDASLFGGNKVRKLEFLLADAVANNARSVLTFGCAGSNHALATAVYAQQLGLKATLVLSDQPCSRVTRRNLLLDVYHGAHLLKAAKSSERVSTGARYCAQHKEQFCSFPYVIPVGGSCARGILGFVNAAFELKEQINAGLLPEPKYIIVACGSYGTAAGLMLGCKAAGLKSVVVPVAVEPEDYAGEMEEGVARKFTETAAFLAEYEPSFAQYTLNASDVQIIHAFQGDAYGLFTAEAIDAMRRMKDVENIALDGVYSGKAVCSLFSWLQNSTDDESILFWNTFDSDAYEAYTSTVNYTQLPIEFHKYFTEDVQPLDR